MPKKTWTEEKVELLKDMWGFKSIKVIAEKLEKTETAVILKAKSLGLGSAYTSELLNANQISQIFGVDRHVITDTWKDKYNLPLKKKTIKKSYQWLISIEKLLKWCKENQKLWDSRKVELFALGSEPKWLKEKRKRDIEMPGRRFYKWTIEEDRKAVALFKIGYRYKDIAKVLNRSTDGVERRLSRLDIWGTGEFIRM